ncbi:hypothetical protein [Tianweitania sediminis]|uniref:Uncharacterized protein n=1 Tax=Tianweitania sediminis TaxID=1502156 RepID=A0A8J7R3U9_9HYPH|nr:hypothetical protein [Tianweitania sediminis]
MGAVFTSSATQHGDQESTILSVHTVLLHFGMGIPGLPYSFKEQTDNSCVIGGSPYGAGTAAGGDDSLFADATTSQERGSRGGTSPNCLPASPPRLSNVSLPPFADLKGPEHDLEENDRGLLPRRGLRLVLRAVPTPSRPLPRRYPGTAGSRAEMVRVFGSMERANDVILGHWGACRQAADDPGTIGIDGRRAQAFEYPSGLLGALARKAAEAQGGQPGHLDHVRRGSESPPDRQPQRGRRQGPGLHRSRDGIRSRQVLRNGRVEVPSNQLREHT